MASISIPLAYKSHYLLRSPVYRPLQLHSPIQIKCSGTILDFFLSYSKIFINVQAEIASEFSLWSMFDWCTWRQLPRIVPTVRKVQLSLSNLGMLLVDSLLFGHFLLFLPLLLLVRLGQMPFFNVFLFTYRLSSE